MRHVYLESLFQDALEANGYRSPTWRILRALQAIIKANVVIGESRLTAAPFFEGAGRPSGPFWGPQQGRRVILWESLSLEDQQKCLNDLQDDTKWGIWCKAKPKDKRRAPAASAPPQHALKRRLRASWCSRTGDQACGQRRGHSDKSVLGRRRHSLAQGTLHSGHAPAQACCNRWSRGRAMHPPRQCMRTLP